ncbi:inositol 2-dehydrogenase [Phytohabitans flavus]|uniref:Inositol 2-dehydrogenase n=1 Tax=Phytohabitans flavus TaxID=1076124 RepID=A0A6F8XN69_9ACTN|nr:Gfo/Idh/MocA family oxidoreductase [Phytohabitans flavus]BCB75263.1 inositol 2-dehydrogenase [Phytohabitans flavus]
MARQPDGIAIVGCGRVSAMHFKGAAAHPDGVRVVAACDPVAERREWARATYGVERVVASLDELLDVAGWHTAIVCTPTHVRTEAVRALAEAGRDILVEKPLADEYEPAAALVDIAEAAGVRLAVNQNFRHFYPFGAARDMIAGGGLGNVLGVAHLDLAYRQEEGWRNEATRHALSVMGVHWLDGFRHMLGREADTVTGRVLSSPALDAVGDTDAHVQIAFGATTVSYVQSFSSRVKLTETVVIGERGTLALGYAGATLTTAEGETALPHPYAGDKPAAAYQSLRDLLDAAALGREAPNSGRDNLHTIALLDAAYRSAGAGRPVEPHQPKEAVAP